MFWLIANFRTGHQKREFNEKPSVFDLVNACYKFSNVYMSYNSHINMNSDVHFEDF